MMGEFGMNKDLFPFSRPQECSVCKRIFSTPQELISHYDSFHSKNRGFTTFPSPGLPVTGLPTTLRPYPNQNRSLSPVFQPRNHFDVNYYRRGYLDEQGRFHRGPPPPSKSNFMFMQNKKPRLMEFFPGTSSDGGRTLPLLSQLEEQRVEEIVVVDGLDIPASIDLSLRL